MTRFLTKPIFAALIVLFSRCTISCSVFSCSSSASRFFRFTPASSTTRCICAASTDIASVNVCVITCCVVSAVLKGLRILSADLDLTFSWIVLYAWSFTATILYAR